ncbi:50S ribosomal protein L33 [Mycoplasmopsis sturni]|nr:50S ribosomal protein L33 [Mycoplasmopsis sturni]
MKTKIAIGCSLCRRKNYWTTKSNGSEKRIAIKKFCQHCDAHTLHKEEV